MENRRILYALIGVVQNIIGILSGAIGVLLGLRIIEVQTILTTPTELLPIYILIIGLFSLFSFTNGFFLIRELQKKLKEEDIN